MSLFQVSFTVESAGRVGVETISELRPPVTTELILLKVVWTSPVGHRSECSVCVEHNLLLFSKSVC